MSDLILPRRKFLLDLAGLVAAPAVVRVASLMPVRVWREPWVLRIHDARNPMTKIARLGDLSHPNMTMEQAYMLFDASARKGLSAHLIGPDGQEFITYGAGVWIPPSRSLCA